MEKRFTPADLKKHENHERMISQKGIRIIWPADSEKNLGERIKDFVRFLWKMPLSKEIVFHNSSYGKKNRLALKKIAITPKIVIFEGINDSKEKMLICYPHHEDAEAFVSGERARIKHEPANVFPGAVGTLSWSRRGNEYSIDRFQATFRQEENPGLTRSKAAKYGGWKVHLLEILLRDAKEKGIEIISAQPGGEFAANLIKKTAREYGYEIEIRNPNDDKIIWKKPF